MTETDHLPVLGVGPIYVAAIFLSTVAALILDGTGLVPSYEPLPSALTSVVALALVLSGIAMWYETVIRERISKKIEENTLVTDGIYSYVRNPIYTALMFVNWGLLIWSGNVWLFVLIPVYWFLMTVMMAATEEKWLTQRYGQEYTDYCRRVNRCIPWFPRRD